MDQPRTTFHTLDALRFLAAIFFLMRHVPDFFAPFDFQQSYLVIDLTFLISGVVLCQRYEKRLKAGLSAGAFLRVRLNRLYPLYFAGSLLGLLAFLLTPQADRSLFQLIAAIACAALMLPNPLTPGLIFPLNPPAWPLFFEIFINAAYGSVARWLSTARLCSLLGISALGLVTIVCFSPGHSLATGWSLASFPTGFVRVIFSFLAGVALYRRFSKGAEFRTSTASIVFWLILAAAAAILIASPASQWHGAYDLVTVLIIFPALVHLALRTEPGSLTAAICGFIGPLAYPIYVLHAPIGKLAKGVLITLTGMPVEALAPWIGIAFVAALVPFCLLALYFYDAPVRRWLARKSAPAPEEA